MRRAAAAVAAVVLAAGASGAQPCPRGDLLAYAHNDYANARPLHDALALGFRGAEADVYLVGGALRVGHDRRAASRAGTLEALYLAPLDSLAARCGALTTDGAPFLLTVELKDASAAARDALVAVLARHVPLVAGPRARVEVVLVGWQPAPDESVPALDALARRQHRLTRPGAPLPRDSAGRVRLLSLDYGKMMGRWWVGARGRRRWLAALAEAKRAMPGRLLRAHNVPADARVYAALRAAGVDLIGTKQLAATRALLGAPDR